MIDIYPQTYNFIYFHFIFILVVAEVFILISGNYRASKKSIGAFLFSMTLLLIIGMRPYNGIGVGQFFGDTINYYISFIQLKQINNSIDFRDAGFGYFSLFFARNANASAFFFALAVLYIIPIFLAVKRIKPHHSYLLLLMIASSFLFWSGGVNGIRAGIGTSLLLLGFTYQEKKFRMLLLFIIAVGFHKSMLLPLLGYGLTFFYKNTKAYIYLWISSIALSLFFSGFWETFFAGFNLGDERFSEYLTTQSDANVFAFTGFRWDFLFFSAVPVLLGYHFIFKKKYQNDFYIRLFNTYLIANSFWILVIRANFSNRFASLSWFLIPIILLLPLLDTTIWKKQKIKIAYILLLNFLFTYYMSLNSIWG